MSNAFERHGIGHLSASSLNLFASQPAMWVAQKLLKRSSSVGPAAHRGTAIEAGVALGLTTGVDDDACIEEAVKVFQTKAAFCNGDARQKEEDAVAPSIRIALAELRPYGPKIVTQEKIEWMHEDIPIPFLGYIDFRWPEHGILIDLKTQLRLNSEIKTPHARQVALYAGAIGNNVDTRVTYCTPKKAATYGLDSPSVHLKALLTVAHTLQRFLSVSADPMELKSLVLPDLESFYWSDPQSRAVAWELWGI